MKFTQTKLTGVFIIELEKHSDNRGFLAHSWDSVAFAKHGLSFQPVQGYTCMTEQAGTLRGFHYVAIPHQEMKVTRVIQGCLYEVVADLRSDSQTFKQWVGITMKDLDYRMLVTPPGCAHAVLTLENDTEYTSLYSPSYDPSIERGVRWNDPAFNLTWPITVTTISDKDKNWPNFI